MKNANGQSILIIWFKDKDIYKFIREIPTRNKKINYRLIYCRKSVTKQVKDINKK